MRNLIKKTLPALLALALTAGCSTSISNIKTKVIGTKYEMPTYDGIFSAKSSSSKSENGLEVFAAKYKDKSMYEKMPFYKAPISELTFGWEIMLKRGDRLQRLTNDSVQDYHPRISQDGTLVVYEKWDKENKKSDIYKIELSQSFTPGTSPSAGTKLTDQEGCENPAISPDGEIIAYNYKGNIWIMDREGKNHKELVKLNAPTRISDWTDKGLIFHVNNSVGPNAIIDFEKKEIRDYHIGE
ncbi:hypothetical protein FJZ53_00165 [Candidatus Woesearchaeota archaeon]|nr:hypothetical protein [Candidatus Woesearchaeota archaeon]